MISLLGIVIGLALFILLAYMGYNTIIVAIASAMVVAVFGGMNPFVALTEAFMPKTVDSCRIFPDLPVQCIICTFHGRFRCSTFYCS